jgi:hypothetical protein
LKFVRLYILATALAVFLTGCASPRLNPFSTFAQAGISYVNASQTLLTEAGNTSINVKAELATLDNIAQALNTISTLVGIVGQIIPMV